MSSAPATTDEVTAAYVTATTYGAIPEVEAALAIVRRAHGPVRGTSHRGITYDAGNPEMGAWVHNALVDPKQFDDRSFVDINGPECIIPQRTCDPYLPGKQPSSGIACGASTAFSGPLPPPGIRAPNGGSFAATIRSSRSITRSASSSTANQTTAP